MCCHAREQGGRSLYPLIIPMLLHLGGLLASALRRDTGSKQVVIYRQAGISCACPNEAALALQAAGIPGPPL